MKHLMLMALASGLASHACFATDGSDQPGGASISTKEITVEGVKLTVGQPYVAGHALNANEAGVLNQTYLENVRNNTAGKIKAHKAAWEKEPTNAGKTYPGFPAAETAEIQKYADDYEFGARVSRSSEPTDPIEREAYRLAKDAVDEALAGKNVKKKDLPEGKYEQMVRTYAANDGVVKEAKRRVDARAKLGNDILGLDTATEPAEEEGAVEGEEAAA